MADKSECITVAGHFLIGIPIDLFSLSNAIRLLFHPGAF